MKANINGVDIAYDDHGAGQPIIFLHAFPLNRSMWNNQLVELLKEQRFRLVAPDFRGCGESGINASVSTMEMFADDIAGLMDFLGMQQACLCGLSMGGYAAFAFLRKYPQRINGLILADTKPTADTAEAKAARERLAQLAEAQGPEAVADFQLPNLISDHTRRQHQEVEIQIRHIANANTGSGLAAASRGMALRPDSTELLATVSCPALVVVGENDALIPPYIAQNYASQIPGAVFSVIPQAGHLANLEQPVTFLETIREFLLTTF
ncbi:alpha/beta hydrolase [Ktedonosporobacter rubrisoli]|uniref:Alpha/beta hydrolase n=1 Tax=Ktedonosporobacter rubrisoli TaxID=2509675 RepID=A0A4P6K106_KTERU|nr:alpha/beta hydrolase [Ktedonosporobacter rubrisoli]QBD81878.1 alpha/beta hydrolase [Ktedonosporobacter rubrisoli]